jgi:Glutamate decarboxylase and related PLP-dependent proteins
MQKEQVLMKEETLDPADWSSVRQLGHRMLDDMIDYLQSVGERPVWKKPPRSAIESMKQPLPRQGRDLSEVYDEFFTQVLPYNTNNIHPRFWSWVQGGGTVGGMLADMLASGMNANVANGDHMAMYVDRAVIEWSKEMMSFPQSASGMLVSGASMANITALIVARNSFNRNIKLHGLRAAPAQLVVYGSAETHNCVLKGVEVIGIGSENFRKIPVDENFRIRTDILRRSIREDRQAGLLPFCIVGNAGTVNTGAIDPLDELVEIAREERLWLHVDGAFGAIPKILPEFEPQLKALEQADSLSFDYHKWLHVNYEVACVLVRDAIAHREAFATAVSYLTVHERGLAGGPEILTNYGMELSRGFKALKVWMSLKEHGIEKYAAMVRQNIRQAQYLAKLVRNEKELELLADVSLNIVCFRYNPGNRTEEELNELNKELLMRLQEQGVAAPSYTVLHNKYAIRAAITNHRSKREDFEEFVKGVVEIGRSL